VTIPNRHQAYIPEEKLGGYLLSESHPGGRAKAALLLRLGFQRTDTELLRQALLHILGTGTLAASVQSPYGTKFVVDGILKAPRDSAPFRTVWIMEPDDPRPRFVTAYPA